MCVLLIRISDDNDTYEWYDGVDEYDLEEELTADYTDDPEDIKALLDDMARSVKIITQYESDVQAGRREYDDSNATFTREQMRKAAIDMGHFVIKMRAKLGIRMNS
jgi:hypothetical protein